LCYAHRQLACVFPPSILLDFFFPRALFSSLLRSGFPPCRPPVRPIISDEPHPFCRHSPHQLQQYSFICWVPCMHPLGWFDWSFCLLCFGGVFWFGLFECLSAPCFLATSHMCDKRFSVPLLLFALRVLVCFLFEFCVVRLCFCLFHLFYTFSKCSDTLDLLFVLLDYSCAYCRARIGPDYCEG